MKKPLPQTGTVTLHAVAKAAGVTIATASRSLNDAYGVHPETRARVLQVAEKLRYKPNRFARGLVTGRSDMIGLIVSDIRNSYFAEVARGVEDAALESGRDVMLSNSDLSAERQTKAIASLLDKRAEAIIMNSVTSLTVADQKRIADAGVPIVLLNRPGRDSTFSTVSADNESGGRLAAEYLLGHGHRTVVSLTGPRKHGNLVRRSSAFTRAIRACPGATVRTVHAMQTLEGGYHASREILQAMNGATAIFTGNDAMAFGVMRAAMEMGIRIPRDLSLIGFDDVELSAMSYPPLTTIHQPKYAVGRAAVEIVNELLGSGVGQALHRIVDVHLVERASVARVKK